MTPLFLQAALKKELTELFSDFHLPTAHFEPDGITVVKDVPKVFEQELPIRNDGEENDDPYPYIIVKIDSGMASENSSHNVVIDLIIGVFDEAKNQNGHKDVLNIIQKIYERFAKDTTLSENYVMLDDEEHPFAWALQEERSYPYYFGAIHCTFAAMAIRKESKYT